MYSAPIFTDVSFHLLFSSRCAAIHVTFLRGMIIGSWMFHCHFLYHIVIGMNLILQVGTQADLPPVPPGFPTCGDHTPPIPIN